MIFRKYILSVVAAVLWLAAPAAATAQDVMELDLAFKNGRLPTSQGQGTAPDVQGRRSDAHEVTTQVVRRHHRPHRHRRS